MNNFINEIIDLITKAYNESSNTLNDDLKNYHEKDIADAYLELSSEMQEYLRNTLDDQFVSDIFSYFADENIEAIEKLDNEEIADIVELMDADDAVDVLEELDSDKQDEILDLMEGDIKEDIKLIDSFNDDEVGSLMTTNFISITENLTIKEAMKEVVRLAENNDNISTLIVVEPNDKYVGTLDIADLIRASQTKLVKDVVRFNTPYIYGHELISDSINKLKEYNQDITPVLDHGDHMLGVITSDDLINIVNDELEEDYAKLAGMSESEDLDESILSSFKKRIPWLMMLLVLGILVSLLISRFESVGKTMTVIVFFQSLVLGMSGNVGTQSLAVTVRVISGKEMKKKDNLKLIFKELKVGFINGTILAIISFICIFLFLLIKHGEIVNGEGFSMIHTLKLCGSISISLIASMSLAAFFGTIIPIIFKRFNVDPAAASGPFITTINDCVSVICYYGLAMLLFYSFIFA